MPTSVFADDDEQIIADLQRDVRRLRSRLATTAPRGGHDAWTAAATPATTYQLSVIPVLGTCEFAINGHEQREGTDYTVDYDVGVVSVSASLVSGDLLVARYLVTDWLVARSLTADTGNLLTETESTFETGLSTGWVLSTPFTPSDTTLTRRTDGGHTGSAYIRMATAAGDAVQDLTAHLTRTITVSDTTNYKVSFWVRPTTSIRVRLQADFANAGGTVLFSLVASGSTLTANVWNYVESPATTTTAGSVTATVQLRQFGTSGGSSPGDTFDADDLFFGEA